MGAKYWSVKSPTKLKKCSERKSNSCETTETDGCCAVIPCDYCLEFYGEFGTATFATNGWSGTISGAAFFGFWERNYDTNECEFVVTLDGVEVYRKSCYQGQSCRDSSDSVEATIDYVTSTLTWTKQEKRPLHYRDDPDTYCKTWFCDKCECTCECLCVTISEALGDNQFDTHLGELCDTAYECDAPLWEGTVGPFDISIALGHDEYGRCVLTPTVDAVEQESVLFPGCADAGSVTFTLADDSTITVRCKECDCASDIGNCYCPRALGPTLLMEFNSGNDEATIHEVTLTYGSYDIDGISCTPFTGEFPAYRGTFTGTIALPMGGSREETIEFVMVCECLDCPECVYYKMESSGVWCVATFDVADCDCPAVITTTNFNDPSCDVWGYQLSGGLITEDESNCT